MHVFKDTHNRTWTLVINVATIKRVRALCGIDLASVISLGADKKPKFELLEQLSSDPVMLVDCLYAICKDEADKLGVSDVQFGESMAGDVIVHATNAFLEELADFFPETKRLIIQKAITAGQRFVEKSQKYVMTVLSDPELDAKLEKSIEQSMS